MQFPFKLDGHNIQTRRNTGKIYGYCAASFFLRKGDRPTVDVHDSQPFNVPTARIVNNEFVDDGIGMIRNRPQRFLVGNACYWRNGNSNRGMIGVGVSVAYRELPLVGTDKI